MGGSPASGRKAAATMKKKYGKGYYKQIGTKGAAARTNPYMHFKVLHEQDPEQLKNIARSGGQARKVNHEPES